ncbi:MAG: phage terminase large subunit family protein [Cytophagaceae bacterium]|nr:phage terminase large subunit family protein [Cytophagaceae bacterium]
MLLDYSLQLDEILESSRIHLSSIKPSEWTEANMIMQKPFPGPFRYSRTPYTREIIDCFAPDHPARIVSVMKGAQVGFSSGVIYPAVGWIMKNQPGNTLLMVGHDDLVEETMTKIDLMIDATGLRPLIRSAVQRNKAGKTGDTNTKKEFPQGYLVVGSANNHKVLRQRDMQYGIIDDFEAVKGSSKESGNSRKLIEQRFAAYADKMKLFYISTPELKQTSNIEPAYMLGDRRKFMVPCPECAEFIDLHWSIAVDGDPKQMAGITWKKDSRGKLVHGSVGYVCQKCAGFFDDRKKNELLQPGFWRPTAEPSRLGNYSYHLSSLYAPAGMYDWEHYALNFEEAHPEGSKRDEHLFQTHQNLCLGLTYEATGETLKANELQKNISKYEIGLIPEKISVNHGNGEIVLITCACDLNGTENDARLDYEVVAWSESGSSYSIEHGSIGTFIPREGAKKNKEDRARWTYEHYRSNSVWPELDKVIGKIYETDTNRKMQIFITGIDCGHYTNHAYTYIDNSNYTVVGLKGKDSDKLVRLSADMPTFKPARERAKLYLVEVNHVKDDLADLMKLKYDSGNDDKQPPGFMNYPIPSSGMYLFDNFFEHYQAEHRIVVNKEGEGISARWVKINTNVQNHFFDVRIYNMTLKEILSSIVCKEAKIKNHTWKDFADLMMGRM